MTTVLVASRRNIDPASGRGASFVRLIIAGLSALGFYGTLSFLELPSNHVLVRYTTGHPIEYATIALFLWGLADLAGKWLRVRWDRAALGFDWLEDVGASLPASEAGAVLEKVARAPRRMLMTSLGRRLCEALADVQDKQASEHLEDYLKDLADQEAERAHSGFALCRVIAWMIPILGFLGTVVGITMAIANITPEQLESSLPEVTAGLAVAFDTTALSLALSMVLIFAMFVVERSEQHVLRAVETRARRLLAHRFLASSPASTPYLSAVHAASEQVIRHTSTLVERQTELWAKSVGDLQARMQQFHANRESAFAGVLEGIANQWRRDTQTIDRAYKQMEQMQLGLTKIAELLIERTGQERALVAAQDRLAENLRMLRQTQSFDEALHSLTAAVHLLTVRVRATADLGSPASPPDTTRDRRVA